MDKIGAEGVAAELDAIGYGASVSKKYIALFDLFEAGATAGESLDKLSDVLEGFIDADVIPNLKTIIESASGAASAKVNIAFDPTLVRGMSYYTGPIFEIEIGDFGSSCGGGGRYDKMVGKFTGQDAPACGFSIGFERIITILLEQGYEVPGSKDKVVYLIEKGMPSDRLSEILKNAETERRSGCEVSVTMMAKNKKFQKEQLGTEGFTQFKEFYINPLQ